jgi:cation transport regulator ChaC
MIWVFAYGSNMNLTHLGRWFASRPGPLGRVVHAEAATLENHRLIFNYYSDRRGSGAANIEAYQGGSLPGVALSVDGAGFRAIDAKEGYPERYDRARVHVLLDSGATVDAWAYIAQSKHTRSGLVRPARRYRDLMVEGAMSFELPEAHVEIILAVETCDE